MCLFKWERRDINKVKYDLSEWFCRGTHMHRTHHGCYGSFEERLCRWVTLLELQQPRHNALQKKQTNPEYVFHNRESWIFTALFHYKWMKIHIVCDAEGFDPKLWSDSIKLPSREQKVHSESKTNLQCFFDSILCWNSSSRKKSKQTVF